MLLAAEPLIQPAVVNLKPHPEPTISTGFLGLKSKRSVGSDSGASCPLLVVIADSKADVRAGQ